MRVMYIGGKNEEIIFPVNDLYKSKFAIEEAEEVLYVF